MAIRTSTFEIVFTLQSEAEDGTKTAIDLTGLVGLVVVAYNEGGKIVAKFSKNAKAGHDPIDTTGTGTDATHGKAIIRIQSDQSAKSLQKNLKLEFHIFQTNTNFTDNLQHDIATGVDVEEIFEPVLKTVEPS
jgi:hypothetical protein